MNSAAGASNVVVQQGNSKKNGKNVSKQPVDLEVKHSIEQLWSLTDVFIKLNMHSYSFFIIFIISNASAAFDSVIFHYFYPFKNREIYTLGNINIIFPIKKNNSVLKNNVYNVNKSSILICMYVHKSVFMFPVAN